MQVRYHISQGDADQRRVRACKANAARRPAANQPPLPNPCDTDREYTSDECEFMNAMAAYQLRTSRRFPTWSEALFVMKSLGYVKPCPS